MTRATKSDVPRAASTRRAGASATARGEHAWKIRSAGKVQVLESPKLARLGWLVHGFSLRPGGESRIGGHPALNLGYTDWDKPHAVNANRVKFAAAFGADDLRWITLQQIHSDAVHVAETAPDAARKGDALVTREGGLLLGVQTADCVPILLADTRTRAVAAIHAGWRGTLARIVVKTLGRMRMELGTDPSDVVAAIGPAIGRCCYEVGPEVAQAFAAQFPAAAEWFDGPFEQLAHGEEPLWLPWLTMMPPGHVPPPPRVQLDLHAANFWQIAASGVPKSQIDVSDLCTACHADLLFSYRREGANTGRMMAAIGLRPPRRMMRRARPARGIPRRKNGHRHD